MENVFWHCFWVGGGHITAFAVPIPVGDVEPVVVGVETVHGTQLGESPGDFGGSFELAECFAGFGVGRLSDAVTKCCSEGHGLVGFSPAHMFQGLVFTKIKVCYCAELHTT